MKNISCIIIFITLLWGNISFAQHNQDTLNVLFVGNSYTFVSNIPQLVSLISDNTSTKLITRKSTAGGARLSEHWRGSRGLNTKEIIKNGDFDVVVLQEQSMGTIEVPDSFIYYSELLCRYIKENGAQPFFYSTWARKKVPQFQKAITDTYVEAATSNKAGIARVGEAWALAQKLRPDIDLYLPDGSHQSPLGAYLTACLFVKVLSQELPAKLARRSEILDANGESVLLMNLDPLDITFCQKVVNEIAK